MRLLPLQPLALPNIIYTLHDYEPFAFTHQGATWTETAVQPLRNVPYPSTPESIAKNLDQEPTLAGQFFVQQYGLARWDARRLPLPDDAVERIVCNPPFGVKLEKPEDIPRLYRKALPEMNRVLAGHLAGAVGADCAGRCGTGCAGFPFQCRLGRQWTDCAGCRLDAGFGRLLCPRLDAPHEHGCSGRLSRPARR